MERGARLFDLLLGGSILAWGILGITRAADMAPVRWAVLVLQLEVGVLVLLRSCCRQLASRRALLASLPSVAVGGIALGLARPPGEWPLISEVVFVIGTGLAVVTFGFLGRSFAVLPSLREVVDRGPYRLVRHPAYAGELLMIAGCAATARAPVTLLLVAVAVAGIVLRIRAEEQLLGHADAYLRYAARVRYRLVPGVW